MNKMNDPVEDLVDGFREGFGEDKEEVARLKFWGIVLAIGAAVGCAIIYAL